MKLLTTYSTDADLINGGTWATYFYKGYYTGTRYSLRCISSYYKHLAGDIEKGTITPVKDLLKNSNDSSTSCDC